uniref:Protein bicaudal C-like protein 1-B n=1 Tax=Noccaea caerulescens TaxID=107243 RepID=A0A1J3E887_NOCCA
MTELQPGNNNNQQPNGGAPPSLPSTSAETLAITAAGSKRLRRPSVRLGEIGGDSYQHQHAAYDLQQGRKPKWTSTAAAATGNRKDSSKSSRTRALSNLSSGYENSGTLDDEREGNVDSFGVGSWRVKKRVGSSTGAVTTTTAAKRVRSNWVSKVGEIDHGDEKISGGEELEGGFRDFSREDSESPIKEESLVRDGGFYGRRRYERNNSSGNKEFELSEPSNMDGVGGGGGREGVKLWLQELGLGRYWPMFEIHEVDEEVLPLLTLEDLKDMGINAVGSRRKMFCAIQKLGREFS